MKIVIIEDEQLLAEDLSDIIKSLDQAFIVSAIINSVAEGVEYFQSHPLPDLIFSDIQLGDGLSFEIFQTMKAQIPVIFCTAYHEYALDAIRTNGIEYILKPFSSETVLQAIHKYRKLKNYFVPAEIDYDLLISSLLGTEAGNNKVSSILVYHRDKIQPVALNDIALFYIDGESTRLHLFNGKSMIVGQPLDELEALAGGTFFRANRQYLVSRRAVADANYYLPRKYVLNLTIPFKVVIVVSKNRTSAFLNWLTRK